MRNVNPSALLYSIGAQNPQQEVFCRVANRLDIPVFFFKHGGIAETFLPPSILDPYLEHNPHLKRTQFLASRVEQNRYTNLTNIRTILVLTIE